MDSNERRMLMVEAKDRLNRINDEIRKLLNTLNMLGFDTKVKLKKIDYSTIQEKNNYVELDVFLEKNIRSFLENEDI